jgi:anti-sigma regulatory factor (Ser/Thr protein kinase)
MENAERAHANRAYVRSLLRETQPEFAIVLESAARELWWPRLPGPSPEHDGAPASPPTITYLGPRHTVAIFRGKPEEVSRMRADLRRELDRCPVTDEIILCASELAANAVLHSDTRKDGGTFTVRTEISPRDYVLIEVEDDGGPWIERSRHSTGGRGLPIVSALASDCGIEATAYSRTVWARFDWPASR